NERFDLIFIDASKAQYKRFFEQSIPMLTHHGAVISDNVFLKGYIAHPHAGHPRYQTIINRLRTFNQYLANHEAFTNTIVPISDGIAVSYKHTEEQTATIHLDLEDESVLQLKDRRHNVATKTSSHRDCRR